MVDGEDEGQFNASLIPERVGDVLRAARLKAGMDLSDVASKTRVPLRHLEAIEAGDYSKLPSPTYCIGFVKAFARSVGADEAEVAKSLRAELGQTPLESRYEHLDEDVDPARIPTKTLAWTAAAIALLLAIAYGAWRSHMASDPVAAPVENEQALPVVENVAVPVAAPANPAGQVTLTATSPVWLRIYDRNDKVLFEKEMVAGEKFVVPANADTPQIRTGRPDLLAVTIDGKPQPALGPPDRMIKNVGISASALAARAPVLSTASAGTTANSAAPQTQP